MGNLFGLGVLFVLLIVGYTFGRRSEAKHYKSIRKREKELAHIPVIINEWKGSL